MEQMEDFTKKCGKMAGLEKTLEGKLVALMQEHGGVLELTRDVIAKQLGTTPNTVGVMVSRLRTKGVIKPKINNVRYELVEQYLA